jgi:hypothetical protein
VQRVGPDPRFAHSRLSNTTIACARGRPSAPVVRCGVVYSTRRRAPCRVRSPAHDGERVLALVVGDRNHDDGRSGSHRGVARSSADELDSPALVDDGPAPRLGRRRGSRARDHPDDDSPAGSCRERDVVIDVVVPEVDDRDGDHLVEPGPRGAGRPRGPRRPNRPRGPGWTGSAVSSRRPSGPTRTRGALWACWAALTHVSGSAGRPAAPRGARQPVATPAHRSLGSTAALSCPAEADVTVVPLHADVHE